MCWVWECISSAEFNHSLSSPKANGDVDLNHLSAFDFWMFSLILVISELKRARTKIQNANGKTLRGSRCFCVSLRFIGVWRCETGSRSQLSFLLGSDSLLCWQGALWFFPQRVKRGGSVGETAGARWTPDLYLAEADQWKATEEVKWSRGIDQSCVVWRFYGFWKNIPSYTACHCVFSSC